MCILHIDGDRVNAVRGARFRGAPAAPRPPMLGEIALAAPNSDGDSPADGRRSQLPGRGEPAAVTPSRHLAGFGAQPQVQPASKRLRRLFRYYRPLGSAEVSERPGGPDVRDPSAPFPGMGAGGSSPPKLGVGGQSFPEPGAGCPISPALGAGRAISPRIGGRGAPAPLLSTSIRMVAARAAGLVKYRRHAACLTAVAPAFTGSRQKRILDPQPAEVVE